LQYWNNAAAQRYQIYSIPSNLLIDGNGVIVAKNLRGEQLLKALSTQLETDPVKIKDNKKGGKKPKKEKKVKKDKKAKKDPAERKED
jgi:hypothetical protein